MILQAIEEDLADAKRRQALIAAEISTLEDQLTRFTTIARKGRPATRKPKAGPPAELNLPRE